MHPMVRAVTTAFVCAPLLAGASRAEGTLLEPVTVTEWKAVYGRIEARDRIPARARLGGTLVSLQVVEGDQVAQGQVLAEVVDEKLAFRLSAIDAQLDALGAQLDNARAEVARGEDLLSRGVTTAQRLDALRTQSDVLAGQIAAMQSERRVVEQQAAEGRVLAPMAGRVLDVPVSAGAVVMPGEAVALLGGGGIFLRLAIPERHARDLELDATILIDGADGPSEGRLARIYPLIESGRVVADVEVADLPDDFVDARVLVRLPVGERQALQVPEAALVTRSGLDFVVVDLDGRPGLRAVVPGQRSGDQVEILSGLQAGDLVLPASAAPATAPAAAGAEHE